MRMIALLTDFGERDSYAAVMKAVILSVNPGVKLIDITHSVSSGAVREAAFILLQSYSYFPKETIFLCVVDPGVGSERSPLAIKTRNYFFVGPDNGVLSLAAEDDGIEKSVKLANRKYFREDISSTFHGRDIFAPVAAYISRRIALSSLGKTVKEIKTVRLPEPEIKNDKIEADIIYADKFGNLITNVKKKLLEGKIFTAMLNRKKIAKIYSCYAQAESKEPFFIKGSFSFWEISLKNDSAREYFSIKKDKRNKLSITILP